MTYNVFGGTLNLTQPTNLQGIWVKFVCAGRLVKVKVKVTRAGKHEV